MAQLTDARCQVDPDLWFETEPLLVAAAKRECARCPVLEQCHRLALELQPDFGVWAGTRWTPHTHRAQEPIHEQERPTGPRPRVQAGRP